jgi:hypothetical protein
METNKDSWKGWNINITLWAIFAEKKSVVNLLRCCQLSFKETRETHHTSKAALTFTGMTGKRTWK